MSTRITIDVVRSGQPRAYADSTTEAYVLLELMPWNKPGEFEPWKIEGSWNGKEIGLDNIPDVLKQYVPALRMPLRKETKHGLEPHLAAFGPAPSRGPGWYRYVTISPFTD